ncbi:MAG TPA: glycoside hydrolase family 2 TIM barrel-domain containing protein [bacterium]|nr:glycoside hydrolase family 2 TIM barrel-domain containing protein [bacterium]HPN44393.1 glycoside hydrolase family 2 TIM barrel-domain containing protein [bacterium]
MKKIYLFIVFAAFLSCTTQVEKSREIIDLQGQWQFAIDTDKAGNAQNWFLKDLQDTIILPGTMDENAKGFLNKDTTTMHLNRVYKYEGPAWYRKKVVIPAGFKDKHIQLVLERSKPSKVWVDSTFVGSSKLLQSAQQFDVSAYLTPGEHSITILVNNDLRLTPYGNVHIYSDDTQTNWNGILGNLYLEASDKTYITNLQVYPDIDAQKITVKLGIDNQLDLDSVAINLFVEKTVNDKTRRLKTVTFKSICQPEIDLEYELGAECSLWDEYDQPLYHLTAEISHGAIKDSQTVPFAMRKFTVKGTQFTINGRTTFLRGKHDAAVFPLTGHPPMDVEGWQRVYKIAKSYGINHYRFHSYCPPEAAFTAADREGIYLQAELPFWGGLDADSTAAMLLDEGLAMLKAYANHPSFVMFSHGNEIWSGHDRVEKNILALKEYDNRPLYTMGSNNNSGYVAPRPCSDFFVAARTPYDHDSTLTHTRLTQAFVDARDGGILNTQTPSTQVKYTYAVSHTNIPVIGHEIAQYQIYPDYNEINKYTGVLRAWNLEVFRHRLQKAGMLDQNMNFHKASGAWSALCYKAEMEAAIRTKGFAGFQLLDLQDFPGQGTALVGILDAFMDSKNVISPQEWRQSCNDVVLLLEFPKYCWTNDEHFIAQAVVANYSNQALNKGLAWEIKDQKGNAVQNGALPAIAIATGELTLAGEINIDLASVKQAAKLTISISIPGTPYSNSYPLWVYPPAAPVAKPQDILVADKLNDSVLHTLQTGGKVLLFPATADVQDNSLPGLFPPDFWNYGMFKGISEWAKKPVSPGTLGLLTDPAHPLFNAFPTDFHTNWQWFSIIKAGNCLILDHTPAEYRPVVQVIDNLERNHKLGLIFEFKVGDGKLLVCMSPLEKLMDKPEAVQLYRSILNYMSSAEFDPAYNITHEELKNLISN